MIMEPLHVAVAPAIPPAALSALGISVCGYQEVSTTSVVRLEPSSAYAKIILVLDGAITLGEQSSDHSRREHQVGLWVPAGHAPVCAGHGGTITCVELLLPPWVSRMIQGELAGDSTIALEDVGAMRGEQLVQRMAATPDWSARFDLVNIAIHDAVSKSARIPCREVLNVWKRLERSAGQISIRDLAREVGWSERYLAQRFFNDVGLLPKLASRQMRFMRTHQLVCGSTMPLADISQLGGYADQSHMTREFTHFAGAGPATIRQARFESLAGTSAELVHAKTRRRG